MVDVQVTEVVDKTDIETLIVQEKGNLGQFCLMLGATGACPTLKAAIEDLLGKLNVRGHDRACILNDFENVAPDKVAEARRRSFLRLNPSAAKPSEAFQ